MRLSRVLHNERKSFGRSDIGIRYKHIANGLLLLI